MTTILIYNPEINAIERYEREESQPMPYSEGNNLLVNEFRGSSNSTVLWSDRRAIEAFNVTRTNWGRPIYVGFAFKRIWEGGHGCQSQHYAGVSFDVAQNLTSAERAQLRNLAESLGVWGYVEPEYLTPTWVHFDRRTGTPACAAGYPTLRFGSRGVYVLVLQDALNALGYTGSGLDGVFGAGTQNAVMRFQRDRGISADGIVGCMTWTELACDARGAGQTATVVNP
ncbi:MAG TPA: peptidase [Clostridiales bacterium]|nr:peptidase [Clostridiales bacterium]